MKPLRSMADVEAANAARGHSWFSPDSVRFFDARVESPFYPLTPARVRLPNRTEWLPVAGYFLHSRQFHGSTGSRPRTFHVAAVGPDGTINPQGYEPSPFPDGYPTLVEAQAALLVLLAPDVRRVPVGEHDPAACEVCGRYDGQHDDEDCWK